MTIREVHQNILIKQQVDVRQKGWQNLLCGTSFINQSNSLQWCVLPQAFETSWGLQLAGRITDTDLVLNSCLCLPGSCLTPRGWAPPPHAYSSTDEDVWDAAFHPQFLCPLSTWGPLGTSTPITLKRSNAWDPPDIHTPGSDSLRLPSAAREKGQAGGNTQGTLENPSHSAAVPGASVAAKARGPHIHASTEEGGGCLLGFCVL